MLFRSDATWESRVIERILHNMGLLLERSFGTVQELNKYRKELARELAQSLTGPASPKTA